MSDLSKVGPVLFRRAGRRSFKSHRVVRRSHGGGHRRGFRRHRVGRIGRTNTEIIKNVGGLPDRQYVKLKYATSSAFTTVGGAPSFVQLKLNSIYRPYASNTDSDGGTATMFSRYRNCVVHGSRVTVRLWSSSTGAVPEPFRMVLVPCTLAQYNVYAAYSNIVTLQDVPHSKMRLVSPGAVMPTLSAYCPTQSIAFGTQKQNDIRLLDSYWAVSGVSPTNTMYWMIAYQNMAGTTSLDLQAEVTIEHYCEFWSMVVSTLPQVSLASNGLNEIIEPYDPTKDVKEEFKKDKDGDVEMKTMFSSAAGAKRKMSMDERDYEIVKALKGVKLKN